MKERLWNPAFRSYLVAEEKEYGYGGGGCADMVAGDELRSLSSNPIVTSYRLGYFVQIISFFSALVFPL